jgi:hypothetical protein
MGVNVLPPMKNVFIALLSLISIPTFANETLECKGSYDDYNVKFEILVSQILEDVWARDPEVASWTF